MSTDDARIERLYALAERLGRLSGEAHNLVNDLTAKIVAHRAETRSTTPVKSKRPSRIKKS
jgi:hypothetical protein